MGRARSTMVLALCLAAPSAFGFSADHHRDFSEDAIQVYVACAAQLDVETPRLGTLLHFARGSRKEDKTQVLSRLTHWHYAYDKSLPSKTYGVVTPHMNEVFARRVRDMNDIAGVGKQSRDVCKADELYEAAGRVAHYVQDMRIPAHVIPIHHGFIFGSDDLDNYVSRKRPARPACSTFEGVAKGTEAPTYVGLAVSAAESTRGALRAEVDFADGKPKSGACTWERLYWCDPRREGSNCNGAHSGFGEYLGKFGNGEIRAGMRDVCGRERVSADARDAFFNARYQGFIEDTVKMLFMVGKLAKGRCN